AAGSPWRAVDIVARRDIVHTDIKPENVMRFADGSWRLIDFDGSGRVGDPVRQFGTLEYASPDMVAAMAQEAEWGAAAAAGSLTADPSQDVWSLGAVVYEL